MWRDETVQPSLRDGYSAGAQPWVETHGYHHEVAPRLPNVRTATKHGRWNGWSCSDLMMVIAVLFYPYKTPTEFDPMQAEHPITVSIQIFCDETGTPEMAGVAGYIATAEQWHQFNLEWRAVLDDFKVRAFHFSEYADLINGPRQASWPYRDWTRDKRTEFINALGSIANRNTHRGVAIMIDVAAYDRLMPAWFKELMVRPERFCLKQFWEDCFHHALTLQTERTAIAPEILKWLSPHTAFFFDYLKPGDAWRNEVERSFDAARRNGQSNFVFSAIPFVPKGEQPSVSLPLQGTDMIAYRLRQVAERNWIDRTRAFCSLDPYLSLNLQYRCFHEEFLRDIVPVIEQKRIYLQHDKDYDFI